jgi:N-acetylmuramoyl-L-alanine amidase
MPVHIVQKGECITSIADQYGFFWETLWAHAENAGLRAERSDPHTLAENDRVFIPELVPKDVTCETAKRHSFRRKGIPALVRLQVFDRMRARKREAFTITLDTGATLSGKTDEEGVLCMALPTRARSGKLVIGPDAFTVELRFGELPPIETLDGVQARLKNLGMFAGEVDGAESPKLTRAVKLFQTAYGLEPSGAVDDATRSLLDAMHDKRDRDPSEIKTP